MLTEEEMGRTKVGAIKLLKNAGIVITPQEEERLAVLRFGLLDPKNIGLQMVVYINTERYCAKEMILFPQQTCPEHRHPPIEGKTGKMETFRCRWGEVYLYVPGERTPEPHAVLPDDRKKYFTVWKEILLKPGEQYTIPPNTLHWFQASPEGAVVSEFSSTSKDEFDVFTDPDIQRWRSTAPVVDQVS